MKCGGDGCGLLLRYVCHEKVITQFVTIRKEGEWFVWLRCENIVGEETEELKLEVLTDDDERVGATFPEFTMQREDLNKQLIMQASKICRKQAQGPRPRRLRENNVARSARDRNRSQPRAIAHDWYSANFGHY